MGVLILGFQRGILMWGYPLQVVKLQVTLQRWEQLPASSAEREVLLKELLSACESIEWQVNITFPYCLRLGLQNVDFLLRVWFLSSRISRMWLPVTLL